MLYGGDACLLGGATAAALHGLHQLPRSGLVRLLMPRSIRRTARGFVRIRRTISMPPPVLFEEFRAVPVTRAVVDACRDLQSLNPVRGLLAESIQRRLTTVAALTVEISSGGSAETRLIRQVLSEVADGARSVAEASTRDLVLRSGLPAGWSCI